MVILLLTAVALAVAVLLLPTQKSLRDTSSSSDISSILGGDLSGFERVLKPKAFQFPADHGAHPQFRNEWWYYTGNLTTLDNRHFGFQVTFFRFGLSSKAKALRKSSWATSQIYMAHFALTDVKTGSFYAMQRYSRGSVGLAGATSQPFRVWVNDWVVESAAQDEIFPMRLKALEGDVALDLRFSQGKDLVLQGTKGLSQKSSLPGNASYYYSFTRMPAMGNIILHGEQFPVKGLGWMDREWGSSALAKDQVGWDWFALQLDDGRELMFYQLRRKGGSIDPFSSGTLVMQDGQSETLGHDEVKVTPIRYWRSQKTRINYPIEWRLEVPHKQLVLQISPYIENQELNLDIVYWEGAVKITGTSYREAIGGQGYVELTGYAESQVKHRAALKAHTP